MGGKQNPFQSNFVVPTHGKQGNLKGGNNMTKETLMEMGLTEVKVVNPATMKSFCTFCNHNS